MAKKKTAAERRRKAAEMREQRLRLERRRKVLNIAGVSTAAALVLGLLAFAVFMEIRSRNIPGMEEFEVGSYEHVTVGERVDYEQTPPVGGNHWAYWQNCAVYSEPVTPELGVHSLEHGAVWINYSPDLAQDEVDALEAMYSPGDYLLISPHDGEPGAPIVASSWGRQVTAETASDEALQRFVERFERGTDVPEPGAACSGAVSATATVVEAGLESGDMSFLGGGAPMDAPAGDDAADTGSGEQDAADEQDSEGDGAAEEDEADTGSEDEETRNEDAEASDAAEE
ncbi:DUF3105 domain-containing protein [Nocardiopsis sp. EMB25]|uniref:DUF3105 domain-containing protein n=1 Tax=Nocardiopsis TaxID=2013 RepID=UPI00034745AF|nr:MULTISPECIES: DUF3105 domain-containing protein [Nocardiopsis]MCY9787799.1 DUF3105 domain-containing protein [Nocardiopsis sp. EMB25]